MPQSLCQGTCLLPSCPCPCRACQQAAPRQPRVPPRPQPAAAAAAAGLPAPLPLLSCCWLPVACRPVLLQWSPPQRWTAPAQSIAGSPTLCPQHPLPCEATCGSASTATHSASTPALLNHSQTAAPAPAQQALLACLGSAVPSAKAGKNSTALPFSGCTARFSMSNRVAPPCTGGRLVHKGQPERQAAAPPEELSLGRVVCCCHHQLHWAALDRASTAKPEHQPDLHPSQQQPHQPHQHPRLPGCVEVDEQRGVALEAILAGQRCREPVLHIEAAGRWIEYGTPPHKHAHHHAPATIRTTSHTRSPSHPPAACLVCQEVLSRLVPRHLQALVAVLPRLRQLPRRAPPATVAVPHQLQRGGQAAGPS